MFEFDKSFSMWGEFKFSVSHSGVMSWGSGQGFEEGAWLATNMVEQGLAKNWPNGRGCKRTTTTKEPNLKEGACLPLDAVFC